MSDSPIFIHSLFRSTSTYFFLKFRTQSGFSAYQEPFHENLEVLNYPERHEELLEGSATLNFRLRHPTLEKSYHYEFYVIRDALRGLFCPEFSYVEYFSQKSKKLPPLQRAYISDIIDNSPPRPMLQFCRSCGRMPAIPDAFGGKHIFLWRHPRVQWWSYKVNSYFDGITRQLYQSNQLPFCLLEVARSLDSGVESGEVFGAQRSYALFYGIWLDAWLRVRPLANLVICVDRLNFDEDERRRIANSISEMAGCGFSLDDFRCPMMNFDAEEDAFYSNIEYRVGDLFVKTGRCGPQDIEGASLAIQNAQPSYELAIGAPGSERNLRLAYIDLMNRFAHMEAEVRRVRSVWDEVRQRIKQLRRKF